MRKWLVGLLIIGSIVCAGIFIYIPSTLKISHATPVYATINGVNRYMQDATKWRAWWPEHNAAPIQFKPDTGMLTYNGFQYRISKHLYNALELDIIGDKSKVNSVIHIMQLSKDTVTLYWTAAFKTSMNPVKRLQQYRRAKNIKENMESLLESLKTFSEKTSNVYGFNITEIISRDSALITTSLEFEQYPATSDIYRLIGKLKVYAASQAARENNYPMLSVRKDKNNHFQTMVAIPVDKRLPGTGSIIPKRFVPWKTLIAEVNGGPGAISDAYEAMNTYTQDHRREAMAIPFESMVTNRTIQQDTSKWVTLICQPVR